MSLERNREFCLALLNEYTKSESLIKHAIAVERCVRYYAEKFNTDVDYWSNAALLHDFDYEMYPSLEDHPFKGAEILKEKGFEEDFINAILSHASHTNVKRETLLQKTLFACDELAGFILAVAYVRPTRSFEDLEVKSVKKKLKDKAFAKAVNREEISEGAELLNISLDDHIQNCIKALKGMNI